jgi:hypothetical protein
LPDADAAHPVPPGLHIVAPLDQWWTGKARDAANGFAYIRPMLGVYPTRHAQFQEIKTKIYEINFCFNFSLFAGGVSTRSPMQTIGPTQRQALH